MSLPDARVGLTIAALPDDRRPLQGDGRLANGEIGAVPTPADVTGRGDPGSSAIREADHSNGHEGRRGTCPIHPG